MELDLENSMQNTNGQTNEFLQELKNSLEQSTINEVTYLDKVLKENKVLEKYKEQMYEERNNILRNYAKDTEEGHLYYIYGMHDNNNRIVYDVIVCNSNDSNKMMLYPSSLPNEAKIRKRIKNRKF